MVTSNVEVVGGSTKETWLLRPLAPNPDGIKIPPVGKSGRPGLKGLIGPLFKREPEPGPAQAKPGPSPVGKNPGPTGPVQARPEVVPPHNSHYLLQALSCETDTNMQAIELMLVDALVEANDVLGISSYIADPSEYWKLDDTILKTIETAPEPELKEARELVLRIRRRELYQFCNEYAVPKDRLDFFKDITAQDVVCSQDYESDEKFYISDDRVSHLLPAAYQDRIVRVYAKKPELVEAVSEAFENFQLRMYGVKAQVHATPEKKKRKR
ncbi:hypothetical protein KSP39_PZI024097 [Platanthera zijinensis]|uniref:Uncharacterized protein n=1 Tax=Platanthera zijinensis TaxID=2320716 RepID=A0AAP0ATV8_9ASPA